MDFTCTTRLHIVAQDVGNVEDSCQLTSVIPQRLLASLPRQGGRWAEKKNCAYAGVAPHPGDEQVTWRAQTASDKAEQSEQNTWKQWRPRHVRRKTAATPMERKRGLRDWCAVSAHTRRYQNRREDKRKSIDFFLSVTSVSISSVRHRRVFCAGARPIWWDDPCVFCC